MESCGLVLAAWCVVGGVELFVVVGLVLSGVTEGIGGVSVRRTGEILGWV